MREYILRMTRTEFRRNALVKGPAAAAALSKVRRCAGVRCDARSLGSLVPGRDGAGLPSISPASLSDVDSRTLITPAGGCRRTRRSSSFAARARSPASTARRNSPSWRRRSHHAALQRRCLVSCARAPASDWPLSARNACLPGNRCAVLSQALHRSSSARSLCSSRLPLASHLWPPPRLFALAFILRFVAKSLLNCTEVSL